jgi:protein involved in polysaccharide export with SLBB domain
VRTGALPGRVSASCGIAMTDNTQTPSSDAASGGGAPAPTALRSRGDAWMKLACVALVLAAIWSVPQHAVLAAGEADAYSLGPTDKIRVRVFEWRATRDETYEWTALNTEYTVNPSGKLSMPLIGDVPASGFTPEQISTAIGDRLRERLGLVEVPGVAVEIVQYRPVYVVGHVEKPGEYLFRPGMSALQAMSLAGGARKSDDGSSLRFAREAIVSRGDMQLVTLEANALAARRARLEAERTGRADIQFPWTAQERQDENLAMLTKQEEWLFATRAHAHATQTATLESMKTYLKQEISSLEGQLGAQVTQLNLMKTEQDTFAKLYSKGLTTGSRKMGLERNVASLDGDRLRLETNVFRARQDLGKAEMALNELNNKRAQDIIVELRQTEDKLSAALQKFETSGRLLFDSEYIAPALMEGQLQQRKVRYTYHVIRMSGGQPTEFEAAETTPLRPGDTLKIERVPVDLPQLRRNAPTAAPAAPKVSGLIEPRIESRTELTASTAVIAPPAVALTTTGINGVEKTGPEHSGAEKIEVEKTSDSVAAPKSKRSGTRTRSRRAAEAAAALTR